MTTAFFTILKMSFYASWLIVALLIIRLLFKRIPQWGYVLLWGLVALRLLVPFSVESRFSLLPDKIPSAEVPIIETMEPVTSYPTTSTDTEVAINAATDIDFLSVLGTFWAIGVLSLAFYFAISYWRLSRKLNTAVLLRENIYQSEMIRVSVVIGILHPRICIPFNIDESSMKHIIAHEKTHIRRGDHRWKLIGYLALMLHWFNPLVWVAYVILGRDIEIACDEAVICNLSQEERANYAQTLVTCSTRHGPANAYPLCFGELGVKTRIRSVMKYKRPTVLNHAMLVAFCIVLGFCFLTNPIRAANSAAQENIAQEPQQSQTEKTIRPIKDLTRVDLGDGPVREQVAFMQEQLDALKHELIEAQKQYEAADKKDRLPLKTLMDHYNECIAQLEAKIKSAKKQIGID